MKTLTTIALLLCFAPALAAQNPEQQTVDANQVMAMVYLRDTEREQQSRGYAGHRRYVLENDRMHKEAELVAEVVCDPNGMKHFSVTSEDGWQAANKHVLRKMLVSESETSAPEVRPKTRLTADNYSFALASIEMIDGRQTYVIDVTPKRRDKYLIEGRVWIDAEDLALVRAEGAPAKNPSFWTRSIHFVHQYRKNGPYWFPTSTLSVTEARLFGSTKVNINYFDYEANTSSAVRSPNQSSIGKEAKHVTN